MRTIKKAYLTLGGCGSGKTTLSKKLAKKKNLFHYEYDKRKQYKTDPFTYPRIILDAWYITNSDVINGCNQLIEKGYDVTVIWLKTTDKQRYENIVNRCRKQGKVYKPWEQFVKMRSGRVEYQEEELLDYFEKNNIRILYK